MESRVKEIDYLKCIFITLMIIFHLVYIGDKYPYAKQIVYTFHMSAFLIISGYLANNRKDARSFLRKFLWIFIPYACMEAAYTVMSHFLPVRESVDAITPAILLDKIFLHPMAKETGFGKGTLVPSEEYHSPGFVRFLRKISGNHQNSCHKKEDQQQEQNNTSFKKDKAHHNQKRQYRQINKQGYKPINNHVIVLKFFCIHRTKF